MTAVFGEQEAVPFAGRIAQTRAGGQRRAGEVEFAIRVLSRGEPATAELRHLPIPAAPQRFLALLPRQFHAECHFTVPFEHTVRAGAVVPICRLPNRHRIRERQRIGRRRRCAQGQRQNEDKKKEMGDLPCGKTLGVRLTAARGVALRAVRG